MALIFFFLYDPELRFSLCSGGCGWVCFSGLFLRGEGAGLESCAVIWGAYRSISCCFTALVFIIHGFSSTLNGITWPLCKDSGLGTLVWETPWLWPRGWIYRASAAIPWAWCLQTLPVTVGYLWSWTLLVNFDLWYSNLFSEPSKRISNLTSVFLDFQYIEVGRCSSSIII